MNVLIMYYSKGGNTRKLAEAIAGGVGQVDGMQRQARGLGLQAQEFRPRTVHRDAIVFRVEGREHAN